MGVHAIYLSAASGVTFNNYTFKLMAEPGTTATLYNPYIESTQYVLAKDALGEVIQLRNVGSVKDEVSLTDGTNTQKNNVKVLEASDIVKMFTTLSELDYAEVRKQVDALMYGIVDSSVIGTGNLQNHFEYSGLANNVDGIGGYRFSLNLATFGVGFTKGTTVEQARTALTGTTLNYQLMTPVVTPIEVSGTLLSYPSGYSVCRKRCC